MPFKAAVYRPKRIRNSTIFVLLRLAEALCKGRPVARLPAFGGKGSINILKEKPAFAGDYFMQLG